MEYTEYGLKITLEELRRMLERAENEAKNWNMESCIYIEGGRYPNIKQYCCYAECDPINHVYSAR